MSYQKVAEIQKMFSSEQRLEEPIKKCKNCGVILMRNKIYCNRECAMNYYVKKRESIFYDGTSKIWQLSMKDWRWRLKNEEQNVKSDRKEIEKNDS